MVRGLARPFGAAPLVRRWIGAALRLLALAALASAPMQPLQAPALAAATFEGVASCAGSTCHGRSEGNGAVVRQDELLHWQDPSSQAGAHSRAYAVLASPRGQRIASALNLGPATSAGACLGCHATNAPTNQRGDRFHLSDGVGCESCHGPSGNWIATHYTVSGTHAANVAHGMLALERPAVRAQNCLDCHFGSAASGQFVTHQMMAAGHPRVSYELDLFSALQQHWNEDADYVARKGRPDSVRMWAVGQAEAVHRSLTLFQQPRLASEGLYPEFYFFDCHSCHRAINDDPNRQRTFETNPARTTMPFGTPPYEDENIIMLSAAARVLAPGEAATFDKAVQAFHTAMSQGRAETAAAAAKVASAAGNLANAMESSTYRGDTAFAVISEISGRAIAPRFTDYAASAQAVMGVDTMLNALVKQGRISVGAAAGIRADVNRAYAAVKSPTTYNPPAFRTALASAANSIEALK